jgi:GAF domain-containing protein
VKLNPGAAAGGGAVILVAALSVLMARRGSLARRGKRRSELDAVYADFMGRAIVAQTEKQVLADLADALRVGLNATSVAVLSSIEQEGTYHPLPDPTGAMPPAPPESARGAWAWLKRNPAPIAVAELADKRFGAMRLPLRELADTYAAAVLAPLVHRGELVGLAAVARPGGAPDPAENAFLERLLPPASAAAANVRLHLDAAMTISLGQ